MNKESRKRLSTMYKYGGSEAVGEMQKKPEDRICIFLNGSPGFQCDKIQAFNSLRRKHGREFSPEELTELTCNTNLCETERKENCPLAFDSLKKEGSNSPFARPVTNNG